MNKEIYQAAVDSLQALIVDVMSSTMKDKYIRVQRLCGIAAMLQREAVKNVEDALATAQRRQGGIILGQNMAMPNVLPQPQEMDYAGEEPAAFVNGFDQGDNGEIERNKMLSTAHVTRLVEDQLNVQKKANEERADEGVANELSNLLDARRTMEARGSFDDKDRHVPSEDDKNTYNIVKERINYITKRLKEKTDAAINKPNPSLVHPELVRRYPSLDGGGEDAGDGGAAHADGGVGVEGAAEEGIEAGVGQGPVGDGGGLPCPDRGILDDG